MIDILGLIDRSLVELSRARFRLYTFALYLDVESSCLAVCADTASNSARLVRRINRFNCAEFGESVERGDLAGAALWQANLGRNLSLGDFALVNMCRLTIPSVTPPTTYLLMLRAMRQREQELLLATPRPAKLMLVCTGPNDEAEFTWVPSASPHSRMSENVMPPPTTGAPG